MLHVVVMMIDVMPTQVRHMSEEDRVRLGAQQAAILQMQVCLIRLISECSSLSY